MNLDYKNKDNGLLVVTLLLYTIVMGLFLFNAPKSVGWDYYSWVNIAQKYTDGHFKEALNAYWSPLMIWLIIPLIKFNLANHREIMVINYLAGYLLILLAFKMTVQYQLKGLAKSLFILAFLLYGISIQVVYYDFVDFLSAICLLAYMVYITDVRIKTDKNYFIITSILAVLCLFGKSFYTYFILFQLLAVFGYKLISNKWKWDIELQNYSKTFFLTIFILSIWVSLLSWKYDSFTISSSGKYNLSLITPEGIGEHFGEVHGLFPPPDKYSTYHWVDATYYPIEKRDFSLNAGAIQYNIDVFKYNSKVLWYSFSYISYFKFSIILFALFALYLKDKNIRNNAIIFIISSLTIMAGYTLVLIEERYFCGVQLLFFVAAFITTVEFSKQKISNKIISTGLIVIVFISFMKFIYFAFETWSNADYSISEKTLAYETRINKLVGIKNSKIATSHSYKGIGDLTCFEICNENNNRNFGSIGKYDNEEKQYSDLKKYAIDYYLYYGCSKIDKSKLCISKELPFYLRDKIPIYVDLEYGVSIYKMKPYN